MSKNTSKLPERNSYIANARKRAGMTQSEFWPLFGITQAGGSQYERQQGMPKSLRLLIQLWIDGEVSSKELRKLARTLMPTEQF